MEVPTRLRRIAVDAIRRLPLRLDTVIHDLNPYRPSSLAVGELTYMT
jgi:hypothetical protein